MAPSDESSFEEVFKPSSKRLKTVDREQRKRSSSSKTRRKYSPGGGNHPATISRPESRGLEFCPLCQFPLKYLVGQTERWHLNECLEMQHRNTAADECPSGAECNSISQQHFRKYSHNLQALRRSGSNLSKDSNVERGFKNKEESIDNRKHMETNTRLKDLGNSNSESRTTKNENLLLKKIDLKNENVGIKTIDADVSSESLELFISDDFTENDYEEFVLDIVDSFENESTEILDSDMTADIDSSNDVKNSIDITNKRYEDKSSVVNDSKKLQNSTIITKLQDDEEKQQQFYTDYDKSISDFSSNETIMKRENTFSALCSSEHHKYNNSQISQQYLPKGKVQDPSISKKLPIIINVKESEKKLRQVNIGSYFGLKKEKSESPVKFQEDLTESPKIVASGNGLSSHLGTTLKSEKSASANEEKTSDKKKRQCPFYKKIPGTAITVDAFSYGSIPGCQQYFLSHFHYDHYGGLKKTFSHEIYCSKVTANLVHMQIKVNSKYIRSLRLNEEIDIDGTKVTLLDANHCPGSVMFLFKLKNGNTFLHTGDFRASQQMTYFPALTRIRIDTLYLDTTYCNPSYNFPTQQETIDFATKTSIEAVMAEPKTLIVCGTYTIGKEKVFMGIADKLNCKICVKTDKKRILSCLGSKDLDDRLISNWQAAQVHVLPMNSINFNALKKHLEAHKNFKKIIAFKPTGWTFSQGITDMSNVKPKVAGCISIYGIPYSEHSSFSELEYFVRHFKPSRIVPTVNVGSPQKRAEMQRIFNDWMGIKR